MTTKPCPFCRGTGIGRMNERRVRSCRWCGGTGERIVDVPKGYDLCPPYGCPEHRPRVQDREPLRRADGGTA